MEANFPVALKLLEEEYLDISNILDQMSQQLFSAQPNFDEHFLKVKVYQKQIRCALLELKHSYQLYFFEQGMPGYLIISDIVFGWLPVPLQRDLMHVTGHSYSGIDIIINK